MGINTKYIKKLKTIKVFSISDFLSTYGISYNFNNNVTHSTLKELFDYLETYQNSLVEQDLSILYRGDGVLVKDSKGEVLCYKTHLLKKREVAEVPCIKNLVVNNNANTKYELKHNKNTKKPKQNSFKKSGRIRELNSAELSKEY